MAVQSISSAWSRQLEAWQSVPAESALWDDLDGFIAALRDLAREKGAEREAGRTALRGAISTLASEFGADLEYFEARIDSWSADAVAWDEAMCVADQVDRLRDELRNRSKLLSAPPAHYAEARRVRQDINALEDAIFSNLSTLDSLFAAPAAPKAAGQPVQESRAVVDTRQSKAEDAPVIAAPQPPAADAINIELDTPATVGLDLHRPLDETGSKYSALTLRQERAIEESVGGVGLVFASSALGFEHLPASVTSLTPTIPQSAAGVLPPNIDGEAEIEEWIANLLMENPGAKRLLVCHPIAAPSQDVADRVRTLAKLGRKFSDRTSVQALLFLAPGGAWAWHTLPEQLREGLSGRASPVLALQPWIHEAVADRLERAGKLHDIEACDAVMEATGGWSWLLDKVLARCGADADPKPAAAEMRAAMKPGGDLREEFERRMGVTPGTAPRKVLDLILAEREVPVDLVEPGMFEAATTPDECAAAVRFLEAMSCVSVRDGVIRIHPFLADALA